MGALLVYDITKHLTFENVGRWMHEVKQYSDPSTVVFLIGNKADLDGEQRAVSKEEAAHFAAQEGMEFIETSALNAQNVEFAFEKVVSEIHKRFLAG